MKILHVARRYGPVGGMERYVWEVTRELAALGHQVEVVCERCHAEPPPGIKVHELGEIAVRPRWLALLRFGRRVARWLHDNPRPDAVIHSHERLDSHHVTTFHGPPFATVRDRPWWKKLSLRIAMQLYLERREQRVARAIVPNSAVISKMLAHYYPEYAHKLTAPVEPGVASGPLREFRAVDPQGGVVGFVGKEWQRKGLPLIVDIVAELRRTRPQLELCVVGPDPDELQPLFAGWQGGYRLLGWRSDSDHLKDFDVLLHPARAEPYGMVIAEAMAAQVPVVVSNVCGAANSVGIDSGAVLPLSAPVGDWAAAVDAQLRRANAPPRFNRDWHAVAVEYETIYKSCMNGDKK
ncbi:MAG: glycosyl transferase family 1 [Gallionellales bacterium GWA2_59_43]|nr:MAG: glycosyl transferase family 1 [Gallionellales bacterium GWA2_59_43]